MRLSAAETANLDAYLTSDGPVLAAAVTWAAMIVTAGAVALASCFVHHSPVPVPHPTTAVYAPYHPVTVSVKP